MYVLSRYTFPKRTCIGLYHLQEHTYNLWGMALVNLPTGRCDAFQLDRLCTTRFVVWSLGYTAVVYVWKAV
jgi:hypothetical protein